jgi:hypothetical protein
MFVVSTCAETPGPSPVAYDPEPSIGFPPLLTVSQPLLPDSETRTFPMSGPQFVTLNGTLLCSPTFNEMCSPDEVDSIHGWLVFTCIFHVTGTVITSPLLVVNVRV